ncbi:MAG: tail fiber domain-containing protein [Melioribacteraceae bacterium]|nr:tail fiber domain-containing protein [Melioribacteraceae bacterium]
MPDLGLDFISKLRPVSCYRKNDDRKRTEYGFIAQDVEKLLDKFGVENYGMVSVADNGTYSMRYDDLFAPLVKAVQQLKEENENLKKEIAAIKNSINEQVKIELSKILLKALDEDAQLKVSLSRTAK